jgi:hypothetical protein
MIFTVRNSGSHGGIARGRVRPMGSDSKIYGDNRHFDNCSYIYRLCSWVVWSSLGRLALLAEGDRALQIILSHNDRREQLTGQSLISTDGSSGLDLHISKNMSSFVRDAASASTHHILQLKHFSALL